MVANFLKRLWVDIKGNVKFAIVMFLLSSLLGGAVVLVRGLAWWQTLILGVILAMLFAWASIATFVSMRGMQRISPPATAHATPSSTQPEQSVAYSLRREILSVCDQMRSWLRQLGPPPEIKEADVRNVSFKEWLDDHALDYRKWHDKYFHGYNLRFAEQIIRFYHQLGERSIGDEELRKILAGNDLRSDDVRTIADRLAALAAQLED